MVKSGDLFKGIGLRTPRHTVINWPNKVIDIVDGYGEHRGVAHGVQKDGIQNGWDARVNKRLGKGWSFVFELVKGKSGRTFLTMTDKGTTGLTGRVLQPEELQEDLPPERSGDASRMLLLQKGLRKKLLAQEGKGNSSLLARRIIILFCTIV